MKRITTTFLLCCLAILAMSQTPDLHLPNPAPTKPPHAIRALGYGLMAVAGANKAINEVMHANPSRFGTGSTFAGREQWKRKYRDFDGGDRSPAYIGSTSFLAWTTDAHHLTNALHTAGIFGGSVCLTIGEKPNFKQLAKRLIIGGMVYGTASHFTFNQVRYGSFFPNRN